MASKVSVAASAFAVALGAASSSHAAPTKYSPVEYFKNYALSTCLSDGYKAEEVSKDSAAAARGYLELGGFPLEAHTAATLLGKEFLKRSYESMSGESLTLMKCIDFYHSKELESLARRYRNKR
jgi:Type VI secretion system (T6SS), amidase immunity protein